MSLSRLFAGSLTLAMAAGATALEGPVPLSWRFQASASTVPEGQPLVIGDTVYAPIGARVYALDVNTGSRKWAFPAGETSGDFRISPARSGDTIIAANTNNFVFAVDSSNGNTLWSYHVGGANARSIVVADSTVYVFTTDGRIVALDARNGQKAWTNDYRMQGSLIGDPAFADGHLIFFISNRLVGLNAATQRESWTMQVDSSNRDGGPFVFGQSIYVVSGSQVAQVNPRSGRPGWILPFPNRLHGGIALTEKGGVAVTEDGKVFTFQVTGRGSVREIGQFSGTVIGTPQVAGDNVIVRMRTGAIHLIDPSRAEAPVLWEYTTLPLPGTMRRLGGADVPADYVTVIAPIAVSNSSMFAIAEDGSLFAWGGALAVDQIGPRISMLSPPMGTVMNGLPDIDFFFRLEDEQTGVMSRSITVTMNGQPMNYEYMPGSGNLFVRIRSAGSTTPGANPQLTDGRKEFVITATDWAGNISERKFYVTINNSLPRLRERTVDDRAGAGGGPRLGGVGGAGGGG